MRLLLSLGTQPNIRCASTLLRKAVAEKATLTEPSRGPLYYKIVCLFNSLSPLVCDRRPDHNFLRL